MPNLTLPARRNASETKDRILTAAKNSFSALGYTHASIREIAFNAKVDSALISRYFGSKQGLFEAALSDSLNRNVGRDLMSNGKAGFGKRLVAHMATDHTDINFQLSMLNCDDPDARIKVLQTADQKLIPPIARWLGGADAEERAKRLLILCGGFALHVRRARLQGGAEPVDESTMTWFAGLLQALVDSDTVSDANQGHQLDD